MIPAPPSRNLIIEPDIARTVAELVQLVNEQIASTREILNAEPVVGSCPHCMKDCGHEVSMEPHHRAQLLKALDNLIERKQDLLGIAGRGQRKYGEHTRRAQTRIEPLPDEPACGPGTPSNSVPQAPQKPSTPQV